MLIFVKRKEEKKSELFVTSYSCQIHVIVVVFFFVPKVCQDEDFALNLYIN